MTGAAARVLLVCAAAFLVQPATAETTASERTTYDHKAYGKAIGDIFREFNDDDYPALERRYRDYLASNARTTDGTWMVRSFQVAFETKFTTEPPGKIEKLFRDWKAQDPDSMLRPVAEAFAWQQRAWLARGSGCYPQRPSSARKAFNALLDRSAAALRQDEMRGKDSPLWHTVAMMVAGGQGRSAAELDALFDAAVNRFPTYVPIYAARMEFLLPDWGGDFERIDRFVRESVRRTAGSEGKGLYARLYMELGAGHPCERLFENSKAEWTEMKSSFEDILQRHPDVWNRNTFAAYACRARDVDTTARLLGELGPDTNLGGRSGISNESCYRMIRPPPPRETLSDARGWSPG